jgi:DNA-binding LacI/PurR family transcriptional regulator
MSDVAERADVSLSTVSRVLSGAARVNEEKRRRVLDAISELEYWPSGAARALASSRPQTVAVLAGATSIYGYAETIRGVEEGARAAGFSVTITVIGSSTDQEVETAIALALSHSVVGVIVLKYDKPGAAALKKLPSSIPVVCIEGSRERGVPQVGFDSAAAGREITDYLLGLGHKTVHHVSIPYGQGDDPRTRGWRRALTEVGAPVPEVLKASWAPESGRALAAVLLAREDVTAVFCGNDEIAIGLIRGLLDAGIDVPGDISVVGFDDHPLAAMTSPPLTTARQDFRHMGNLAFETLLRQAWVGDAGGLHQLLRPEVVYRSSAAAPSS